MPMVFTKNGKNPPKVEHWVMPLSDDRKPVLPQLRRLSVCGRIGGKKGPMVKRAMTVAKRLIPLKHEP